MTELSKRYALASDVVRVLAFLADLEAWHRLPWYQRLITSKPQMPKELA